MAVKINEFIEASVNWRVCPFGFYTDEAESLDETPQALKKTELFKLSQNRIELRNYCVKTGILTPKFVFGKKFEPLAAWAVKRNSFPMAIKPEENRSNGEFCFLLKAFRELNEFYEKIAAQCKGNVILEEFIQTKHLIEVTIINGQIRLIAQVAFEKSMLLRHACRVYPISVPDFVKKELASILGKFGELKTLKNIPCRFSFALRKHHLVLLSLNIGMNRPEYHPRFSRAAGIDNIFESPQEVKSNAICKVMNFFNVGQNDYDSAELEAILNSCRHKCAYGAEQTIIMLANESAKELANKTKEIEAFFRRHCSLPSEPQF